eukprot:7377567-Prymnesium_polylepis.1
MRELNPPEAAPAIFQICNRYKLSRNAFAHTTVLQQHIGKCPAPTKGCHPTPVDFVVRKAVEWQRQRRLRH